MTDTPITETAFRAFVQTTGLFRNRMDAYFAQHGVSSAQWGVLRTLQRAADEGLHGLQLNELSNRLLVRPPSVTSIIDRLERSGLVTRKPAPEDQRAKLVALTEAGKQLLRKVLKHHHEQIETIMSGLNVNEQKQLCRLMLRLADHLQELERIS